MTAQALAVLGTGSDVGKSLITAGRCRLLHREGVHMAPFLMTGLNRPRTRFQ